MTDTDNRPEASAEDERPVPKTKAASAGVDRKGKRLFLVIAIIVVAGVYYLTSRGPSWSDWEEDLDAAMKEAAKDDRPLLVFFTASRPGQITRRMLDTTLAKPHNKQAVNSGGFIRVHVATPSRMDSAEATRFKIKKLPTMLILGPDGAERNRREGEDIIPELPFRHGFLDCTDVRKPGD